MVKFTFDVESDWGGRSDTIHGIKQGIPYILELLDKHNIKAIFFLSTVYLDRYLDIAKVIQSKGHIIGSHGHEHRSWRFAKWWEWRIDYMKSADLIRKHFGVDRAKLLYRAPKFSYSIKDQVYSNRANHISVLKQSLFEKPVSDDSILYAHPFDFPQPVTEAPNLLLATLYSRFPNRRRLFESYLAKYSKCDSTVQVVS